MCLPKALIITEIGLGNCKLNGLRLLGCPPQTENNGSVPFPIPSGLVSCCPVASRPVLVLWAGRISLSATESTGNPEASRSLGVIGTRHDGVLERRMGWDSNPRWRNPHISFQD